MSLTQVQSGMFQTTAQYYGFKNRIINGAMVIDQRDNGASVSLSSGSAFVLDRWRFWANGSGGSAAYTVQQSSVAPNGFNNSVVITQTAAYSPTGFNYNIFAQYIEGYNVADLGWGTSSAQTVTLSFWVRSSLTGTFGGVISNASQSRSYPFTYVINNANTWEQKSITIAGDTTGTWNKDINAGILLFWQLGVGSSYLGTAGAWAGATYLGATGATQITATNGATFYITGVQLEVGTQATSFDYRPYGTELALCQRYYQQFASGGSGSFYSIGVGNVQASGTNAYVAGFLKVTMRGSPSFSYSGTLGTDIKYNITGDATPSSLSADQINTDSYSLNVGVSGTGGQCVRLASFTTSGIVKFTSEL